MHRWKITALAAAVVAFGLSSGETSAMALGKITVKSALGEPLRAEIDIPQISAAEADTLQIKTASADVFRAQGMEYTATAGGVQARLQRRANGTAVIVLSTQRPVNDPFVDYVIDANWNSGQVVRSYTMLFDPSNLKKATPAVTTAPQISDSAPPVASRQPPVRVFEDAPLKNTASTAVDKPVSTAGARISTPADNASYSGDTIRVQRGDTAGHIAAMGKAADVSLDQMLIAVMQANPHAFVDGNVNRLKAGVVINMPSAEQARAISASKARQMVAAQSRDFNDYRRQLAGKVSPANVAVDSRSASGKVEGVVTDKKAPPVGSDKVTMTPVEAGKNSAPRTGEARVADAEQANAIESRKSELDKNIEEMRKIKEAAQAASNAAKPADSAPGITVTAPLAPPTPVVETTPTATAEVNPPTVAPTEAPANPAPTEPTPEPTPAVADAQPSATVAPVTPPPAPVAPPAQTAPAPAPVPAPVVEDSSFISSPLVLSLGGGLLALLLGWFGYRSYQRRKFAGDLGHDSAMESNLSQDSFFGASGGQQIDTAVSAMTTGASSLAYTPSQLDAGDVDPVAEADVYLAYGRDLQAEEILKEALRSAPGRTALHAKLAEIYTKRKDRMALEVIAKEARQLTHGTGPDWLRIAAMGQELDPSNTLYQNNVAAVPSPESLTPAAIAAAAEAARAAPIQFENTLPPGITPRHADVQSDFGPVSGLDFAMSSQLTEAPDAPGTASAALGGASGMATTAAAHTPASRPVAPAASMADFDRQMADALSQPSELQPTKLATLPDNIHTQPGALDFKMSDFDIPSTTQLPLSKSSTHTMDFDMTSLSLDLPGSGEPERTHPATLSDDSFDSMINDSDPLATKLTLAQEFLAIADKQGALALAQEVFAEATSPTIKAQAQRLMDQSR